MASALLCALLLAQAPPPPAGGPDAGAKAAPAAPKKKPPAKAAGQLGSPKEDEPEGAGAGASGVCGGAEADTALVRGVLWAFEPAPEEIRIIAVEDLALLGDARALNPLAELIFDPNTNVQLAALRTVAKFQTPRAEEILENVVRHPRLPDLLKIRALQSLGFQASPTAREFLSESATNGRLSAPVRASARQALQDLQPPFAPSGTR